ncbi:MAG: pyruvate formate lyase family protein, partial [Clostridia bacterium]
MNQTVETKYNFDQWGNFRGSSWKNNINIRDFIFENYTPYDGDDKFLSSATQRTKELNKKYEKLHLEETQNNGVLSVDTQNVSSLLTYNPGYLDKENEIILGLQTSKPLERGINPFGGMRMAVQACESYGYEVSDKIKDEFRFKSTHNDGVFRVYTPEIKKARHCGIITGLPDAYGRGRLVGDYRRVALYGTDVLIAEKNIDKLEIGKKDLTEENIRLCEELFKQIDFLKKLDAMAKMYGCDISKPAKNAKEAVQSIYFAYLAAIKEQNGAAMSLGRVSTFLDIYFQIDIKNGILNESSAQEIIDDFILKLRMSRQLRTPDYNNLFAGDPTWITESIGGMCIDGRTHVTKTSFRFLHTLYNLGPAPEPNLTILWSQNLPNNFKKYCAKVSIETDSIQYENDDLMREIYGDDYAIACCVSAAKIGKQMQFFGARCNLAKTLLMALNGGKDEITGEQIGPKEEIFSDKKPLEFTEVYNAFKFYRKWVCKVYVDAMNIIHFMHDKYAYEKIQMALHDTDVHRFMSFGMSGLSVVADSLSAIKYAKVTPIKNESGIICDFNIEGDYPKYGNDDDKVDLIAKQLCDELIADLKEHK